MTIARTAVFALPVGLFFAAAATPSRAGSVLATASASTIGSGLGLWPAGKLLDRIGPWRGLRLAMLAGGASLALLAVALGHGWPQSGVLTVAVVSGAVWAPLIATPRALLPDIVSRSRLPWASGIEAASIEIALILAPLAGALLGRAGPAVVPAAAASSLGVAALALPPQVDRSGTALAGEPLVSREVLALSALALLLGISGGLLEPGLAALPSAPFGDLAGNATLFIAIGIGSAGGGMAAARAGWPHQTAHGGLLFGLHAVALTGTALTDGPVQLGLLVLAGLPIAPLQSLAGLHLDRWTGPTRASETFGLVAATLTLGTGLGQAVAAHAAGQLAPQNLVLLSAAPPALAALLVAIRRTRPTAPPTGTRSS